MQLWQTYLKRLSAILPVGTMGASLLLGASLPSQATPASTDVAVATQDVSERLSAVRQAVSMSLQSPAMKPDPNIVLAWGNRWNNWGWRGRPGRGGWNNFRPRWNNWPNSWRNW